MRRFSGSPANIFTYILLWTFLFSLICFFFYKRVSRVFKRMGESHFLVVSNCLQSINNSFRFPLLKEISHRLSWSIRNVSKKFYLLPERARWKVSLELVSIWIFLDSLDLIEKFKDFYYCVESLFLPILNFSLSLWILHSMNGIRIYKFVCIYVVDQPLLVVYRANEIMLSHVLNKSLRELKHLHFPRLAWFGRSGTRTKE